MKISKDGWAMGQSLSMNSKATKAMVLHQTPAETSIRRKIKFLSNTGKSSNMNYLRPYEYMTGQHLPKTDKLMNPLDQNPIERHETAVISHQYIIYKII